MVMKKILLILLLGCVLIAGAGSVCDPVLCLTCNITHASCTSCPTSYVYVNDTVSPNCTPAFPVFINTNVVDVPEGEEIKLLCAYTLSNANLTFIWEKNEQIIHNQNKSELVLSRVRSPDSGSYGCVVNSTCGSYKSSLCIVAVKNQSVIFLVICGVSALVLILIMGLAMKFKLKRDNDKHKERRKQRVQGGQSGGPAPFTPRES